jgi:hypothetical protein
MTQIQDTVNSLWLQIAEAKKINDQRKAAAKRLFDLIFPLVCEEILKAGTELKISQDDNEVKKVTVDLLEQKYEKYLEQVTREFTMSYNDHHRQILGTLAIDMIRGAFVVRFKIVNIQPWKIEISWDNVY